MKLFYILLLSLFAFANCKLFSEKNNVCVLVVSEGESCADSSQCLGGFNSCAPDASFNYVCQPLKLLSGKTCTSDDDCYDQYTDINQFDTGDKFMLGCFATKGSTSRKICQFRHRGVGDSCTENGQCQTNFCHSGICQTRGLNQSCGENSYSSDCDIKVHHCSSEGYCVKIPDAEGESCEFMCQNEDHSIYCDEETKKCAFKRFSGDPCSTDDQCIANNVCSQQVCTRPRFVGESCTDQIGCEYGSDCVEGTCRAWTTMCATTSDCNDHRAVCACNAGAEQGICVYRSATGSRYIAEVGLAHDCAINKCNMLYLEAAMYDPDSCMSRMCYPEMMAHLKKLERTLKSAGLRFPTLPVYQSSGTTKITASIVTLLIASLFQLVFLV